MYTRHRPRHLKLPSTSPANSRSTRSLPRKGVLSVWRQQRQPVEMGVVSLRWASPCPRAIQSGAFQEMRSAVNCASYITLALRRKTFCAVFPCRKRSRNSPNCDPPPARFALLSSSLRTEILRDRRFPCSQAGCFPHM